MYNVRRLPKSVLLLASLGAGQTLLLLGAAAAAASLPVALAAGWGAYRSGGYLRIAFLLTGLGYAASLAMVATGHGAAAAIAFLVTVAVALAAFANDVSTIAERARQRWMHDVTGNISGGVVFLDAAGRSIFANPVAAQMLGVDNPVGQDFHALAHRDRDELPENCPMLAVLSGGSPYTERSDVFIASDGGAFPVACTASPIIRRGKHIGSIVFFRDTTLEQEAGAFVRHSEQSYHLLFENNPHPMWIYDVESLRFLTVNSAAVEHYGYSKEEFVQLTLRDIRPESELPALLAAVSQPPARTNGTIFRHRTRAGMLLDVEITSTDIVYANRRSRLVMAVDVTDRRVASEVINRLTLYDPLTDLPNRQQLVEHVRAAIAFADASRCGTAIMVLDIDRFRAVNDSFGRATGDELLKVVAGRVSSRVRKGDVVARQANDQFFILLSEVRELREISEMAERLLKLFEQPFNVGGREIFAAASIGVTHYPANAGGPDELLRNAESALHFAKKDGGGKYALFEHAMQAATTKRRELENALRRGIENREFVLHYQPQIDLASGAIAGMEALVRWQHPILGLVPPADFIPLAEETGLIVPMGEWILRSACEQHRRWFSNGTPPLRMGVNLSPRQLLDPELPQTVERILAETGMAARHLELEVTEGSFVGNAAAALATFERIRAIGAGLSIDDFGTGYSSLSYLKRFPFNTLKIDRAFITGINHDEFDQALVRSITTVAQNRQMIVIAEGVETCEQLTALRGIGCQEVQGYYYSKPLAHQDFDRFIHAWEPAAARN